MEAQRIREGVKLMQEGDKAYVIETTCLEINRDKEKSGFSCLLYIMSFSIITN